MDLKSRFVDKYTDFRSLAAVEVLDKDYRIQIVRRPLSSVAIIAPHGGSIERRTSAISRAIARDDFNLYLFEGLDPGGSFEQLHITSHRFDEPQCLELIERCNHVVAVHGYGGDKHEIILGGRDVDLINDFKDALRAIPVDVVTEGHHYPGTHRANICNRGARSAGVQLELSDALRGSKFEADIIDTLRAVLLAC